jgi:hypothetical protein
MSGMMRRKRRDRKSGGGSGSGSSSSGWWGRGLAKCDSELIGVSPRDNTRGRLRQSDHRSVLISSFRSGGIYTSSLDINVICEVVRRHVCIISLFREERRRR